MEGREIKNYVELLGIWIFKLYSSLRKRQYQKTFGYGKSYATIKQNII